MVISNLNIKYWHSRFLFVELLVILLVKKFVRIIASHALRIHP